MKNLLYYEVYVDVGKNYAVYVLPSNLPFPSPLGAEIFLACDDSHLLYGFRGAVVIGYEHREYHDRKTQITTLGAMYMLLNPPFTNDVDRNYSIRPECYEEFRVEMTEFGWEVHEESPELWKKEEEPPRD